MLHRKIIFSLMLLMLVTNMNIGAQNCVTSWEEYNFSFIEILKLKKLVRKKNYEAAYRLGMYYSVIENNDNNAQKYFKIAAEYNHINSIYEIIRYNLLINTKESNIEVQRYKDQLKQIAVSNGLDKDYYIKNLNF